MNEPNANERQWRDETLQKLAEARATMRQLLCLSGDWVAKAQIESQFNYLERDIRDFVRHQLCVPEKPKKR